MSILHTKGVACRSEVDVAGSGLKFQGRPLEFETLSTFVIDSVTFAS